MIQVVKRNGQVVNFNKTKIKRAIVAAMKNGSKVYMPDIARICSFDIERQLQNSEEPVPVSQIETMVYDSLVHYGQAQTAKAYEGFRAIQEFKREVNTTDEEILSLIAGTNEKLAKENSNKKSKRLSTQRDLIAGVNSKDLALRKLLPPRVVQAHMLGQVHVHDADYILGKSFNCCLTNLKTMLEDGTMMNDIKIDPQNKLLTAMTVATQIAAQMTSSQWGGNSFSLSHFAKVAQETKDNHFASVEKELTEAGLEPTQKQVENIANKRWKIELRDAVQTFGYQLLTFATASGQSPFLTLFIYLSEEPGTEAIVAELAQEFFLQRIKGVKNRAGAFVPVSFPKIIYVLDENNTYEGSEFFWLTQLAAKTITKTMMPDMISAKIMKEQTGGYVYPAMGCRSFLNTWVNPETGQPEWYGRFNAGVITLNLPDAALAAKGDLNLFYQILDDRLEIVREFMSWRKEYMSDTTTDVSPIHYEDGAISRLPKGSLTKDLWTQRTSISLGYVGLYETVQALIGQSNSTEEGKQLSLEILTHLKEWTDAMKEELDLGVGLYGTPGESNLGTLLNKTRNTYGVIPNVTDKSYFTNSFHITPSEEIDAFSKLTYEAPFHAISSGGCIS